jgi:hypothetical protein
MSMFVDVEEVWLLFVAVDSGRDFPFVSGSDVLEGRGLDETLRFESGCGF